MIGPERNSQLPCIQVTDVRGIAIEAGRFVGANKIGFFCAKPGTWLTAPGTSQKYGWARNK
jgi:hypothetical protein